MNKKVAAPGLENSLTAVGTRCATPLYPQKLALTSPTSGGRSVGIVRSRTKATEFVLEQLSFHSVAAVLIQTKQIRIHIHKRNNTKIQYKQKQVQYKYAY